MASLLLEGQKKVKIMGLGFDGQLPLLLLLKDGVGTGESVHGGTGVWRARRRHR